MRRTSPAALSVAILTMLTVTACGGTTPPPTGPGGGGGIVTVDPTTAAPTTAAPSTPVAPTGAGDPAGGDCYTYDAQMLLSNYAAGVHAIRVDHGDEIIRVYGGPGDVVGDKAMAVATRFNKVCFIGRGNSFGSPAYVFEYWREPSGMIHPDEPADLGSECVDYAPADLEVRPNPGGPGFVVRAGGLVLQVLATEADANAVKAVLNFEGQLCYILNRDAADARADITFTFNSGD